jgi:hypothetical protein
MDIIRFLYYNISYTQQWRAVSILVLICGMWAVTQRWTITLSLPLAAVFFVLSPPHPTQAQDETCKTCHEHRYYVYDAGKWICLCEALMHCVYCHHGDPESLVKETAHAGMVRFPARSQAERFQTCHEADTLFSLVAF